MGHGNSVAATGAETPMWQKAATGFAQGVASTDQRSTRGQNSLAPVGAATANWMKWIKNRRQGSATADEYDSAPSPYMDRGGDYA